MKRETVDRYDRQSDGEPMSELTADAIASRHPLLTLKDVRKRISVSQSTIYLWMDKGKFPKPIRLGDACVRWREEDLSAWLASKCCAAPQ